MHKILPVIRPALAFVLLLLALVAPSAIAQGTVVIQPAETVSSGIATNNWVAVGTNTVLRSLIVQNIGVNDMWVIVYDSRTNQLDNASTNMAAWKISAGATDYFDPPGGQVFRRGVNITQSTCYPTLTNVAAGSSAFVITVLHSR